MMFERYCRKCDKEIPHDGMTMYEGKEICECNSEKGEDDLK